MQKVCIVGDILIDLDKGWAEPFHDGDSVIIWKYHDFETGEETILEPGKGVITDITVFNEMENLKELYLFAQPLENINGIQNLSNLECLQLKYCTDLTDVSAAFACQQLQSINLYGCPVGSIRGVQNLPNLTDLTISETKVTDISPLKDVNYTYANEHGGFSLYLGATGIEDFSPLACVPVFASLEVNNNDAVLFVKHLKGVEIRRITACDCFMGRQGEDPNALLAEFIKDHPEIIDLCISWNNGLTDLTPVITLKNLERFRVSFDMEEAVLSLEGKEYGFEIEIEQ